MRILYGVVGEGKGHATRSRVVLEHLLGQGRARCATWCPGEKRPKLLNAPAMGKRKS